MNSPLTSADSAIASSTTLLAAFQQLTAPDVLQSPALHPFASSGEDTTATLNEIIRTTDQLSHSLDQHSSTTFSNPKLVSILRQQTAILHTLHLVNTHTNIISMNTERKAVNPKYSTNR